MLANDRRLEKDIARVREDVGGLDSLEGGDWGAVRSQFTCFTGTKAQILTLRTCCVRHPLGRARSSRATTGFTSFTGTKVKYSRCAPAACTASGNLSDVLAAAEQKQATDEALLDRKIDAHVDSLRSSSAAALRAEHQEIRAQLAEAWVLKLLAVLVQKYKYWRRSCDPNAARRGLSTEITCVTIFYSYKSTNTDAGAAAAAGSLWRGQRAGYRSDGQAGYAAERGK